MKGIFQLGWMKSKPKLVLIARTKTRKKTKTETEKETYFGRPMLAVNFGQFSFRPLLDFVISNDVH